MAFEPFFPDMTVWHDLTRYEIPEGYPTRAEPLRTGKRYRAALHVTPSATVYSTKYFDTQAEAEQAADSKIEEMTKGQTK